MFITHKSKIYFFIIVFLFWFFRIPYLGSDITNNDSQRWLNRSEGFLQALKDRDFESTLQKYHPGVTLMLINSVTRQIFYMYQYNFTDIKINLNSPEFFPYTNFFSKLSLILIIFCLVLLQIDLIKKIWGENVSLIYFLFLSIETYFIGINRWFHLTSLEVVLSFTAVLCLIYWKNSLIRKYFLFSSFFLALSVLTKVTSVIIFVALFLILIDYYRSTKKFSIFFYYFLIYLLTIFIFFPALWISPINTSLYILDSIFNAVGDDLRYYQLNNTVYYFYYLIILLYKLAPFTLIYFVASFSKIKFLLRENLLPIYTIIFSYLFFLSVSDQKIDRYSLVFFQPIFLIVALFLGSLSSKLYKFLLLCHILVVFILNYMFFPQFSAYYNPLVGGTSQALKVGIYENSGSYMFDAADYLNYNFPNSSVIVLDNYESFASFYKYQIYRDLSYKSDFIVSTLDIDRVTFNNFNCINLIKLFGPYDKKVVAIFSCL